MIPVLSPSGDGEILYLGASTVFHRENNVTFCVLREASGSQKPFLDRVGYIIKIYCVVLRVLHQIRAVGWQGVGTQTSASTSGDMDDSETFCEVSAG